MATGAAPSQAAPAAGPAEASTEDEDQANPDFEYLDISEAAWDSMPVSNGILMRTMVGIMQQLVDHQGYSRDGQKQTRAKMIGLLTVPPFNGDRTTTTYPVSYTHLTLPTKRIV